MHILLVADGRSPTTRSYIENLVSLEFRVSLASTFPCLPSPGIESFAVFPVAFGCFAGSQVGTPMGSAAGFSGLKKRLARLLRTSIRPLRYFLGPLTIRLHTAAFLAFIDQVKPDLVHALRIPFEGMLSAYTPRQFPLVVSTWGNDLTLHAQASTIMRAATRRTLQRADGFMADTRRDIRLAIDWGFSPEHPALFVPGSAGIRLDRIDQRSPAIREQLPARVLAARKLVINPRGFRPGSVRNDTFFRAIPLVLEKEPDVLFVCTAMQGQPEAMDWVDRLHIKDNVLLLPHLPQDVLWELFHRSQISVSVSQHDGTPNSLLEAMACGCFPIAGDIESLRDWITPGVNGLLVDPADPSALADALLLALRDTLLRSKAAAGNRQIIVERAEAGVVGKNIRQFYNHFAPDVRA